MMILEVGKTYTTLARRHVKIGHQERSFPWSAWMFKEYKGAAEYWFIDGRHASSDSMRLMVEVDLPIAAPAPPAPALGKVHISFVLDMATGAASDFKATPIP